jgi:hypothetical protein
LVFDNAELITPTKMGGSYSREVHLPRFDIPREEAYNSKSNNVVKFVV